MYACICRGITEAAVRQAGHAGVIAPGALIMVLGLDDDACCGRCANRVQDFVALALEGRHDGPNAGAAMTAAQAV